MNPRTVEILLMDAVARRPMSNRDKWFFVIVADVLHCVPVENSEAGVPTYGTCTEYQANNGFTIPEWRELVGTVNSYCIQEKICLKTLKAATKNT